MTCDAARERFSDLMDGELDEAVRPRVEEHLTACGSCRLEWAKFRQTVDAVRGMPQLSAPKGFAEDLRQQFERAELLDREAARKPSWAGWKRPLMLLAAAAVVLVVARVGLESGTPSASSRPPAPKVSEPAWEAPAPGSVLALKDNASQAGPPGEPVQIRSDDTGHQDEMPAPPSPLLLAWVMPCADAAAGERQLRGAFAAEFQKEHADPKQKPALEEEGKGMLAGRLSPAAGNERSPQRLTLKVRASELKEVARRLEALGARPTLETDETVLSMLCLGVGRVQKSAAAEMRQMEDAGTEPGGDQNRRAEGGAAGREKEADKQADYDFKSLWENGFSSNAFRGDLPEAGTGEGWVTVTVLLEPLPAAKPPDGKP